MGAAREMRDAFLRDRFSMDAPLAVFAAGDDSDAGGRSGGRKRSADSAGLPPAVRDSKMARLARLADDDEDAPFPGQPIPRYILS